MQEVTLVGLRGVILHASVPRTRRERMRGLLGRAALEQDRAVWFAGARSIHTFGMRFPIVVAHLGPELDVLRVATVPPGRLVLPRSGSRHVLECAVGTDVRAGDRLRVARPAARAAG